MTSPTPPGPDNSGRITNAQSAPAAGMHCRDDRVRNQAPFVGQWDCLGKLVEISGSEP